MGKERILIIDDNQQDRKAMAVALKKSGYSDVSFAESGNEGIQVAASFRPDIVIIDVVLQEMDDGIDICKQIKSIEGLQAKVIIITGHLEAIDAPKARTSGADEIIEKKVGFANISQTIEALKER